MKRATGFCVLLLLLAAPLSVAGQSAAGEFTISIENSIDTPDRTVTVEGSEYVVSSVSGVMSGDSVTLSTTAPGDAQYEIYLYDSARQIIATQSASGNASWTIDSSNYEPGSYVVAIRGPEGEYRAVQPVVFSAYQVDLTVPSAVESELTMDVGVRLTQIAAIDSEVSVEIVLISDGVSRQTEATESEPGEYTASLLVDVEAGEYRIYATVRGDEETYDSQAELIGISDGQEITIETSEDTDDSGSNGGKEETDETAQPPLTGTLQPPSTETGRDQEGSPTEAAAAGNTQTATASAIVTPMVPKSTSATSGVNSGGWEWMGLVAVLVIINLIAIRVMFL